MFIIYDKITKRITSVADAFEDIEDLDTSTHAVLEQFGEAMPDASLKMISNDLLNIVDRPQGELDGEADARKTIIADIEKQFSSTLKAFSLVMLDEINLLRTEAALPERTIAQLKNAVKNKL